MSLRPPLIPLSLRPPFGDQGNIGGSGDQGISASSLYFFYKKKGSGASLLIPRGTPIGVPPRISLQKIRPARSLVRAGRIFFL